MHAPVSRGGGGDNKGICKYRACKIEENKEKFKMTQIYMLRGQTANDMKMTLLILAESIVVNLKAIYLYPLCSLMC